MMTDDDELAMQAGAGDAQAFRLLLERHYDRIYRVAYRFFGNRADAEDIAQDVCAALPKKLKSFAARARFTTWIYQVVVNACRDQLRSQTSRAALNKVYVEVSELVSAGERDREKQVEWLYVALDHLTPQLRETAILVLAEDLNHREAGEILGVKETTVSWRMHEMRKELKALAAADDGDHP